MKYSLADEQIVLRLNFLTKEEELFASTKFGKFTKIKDWDDKGQLVIWEGVIEDSSLKQSYKIQIHYGWLYPYRRPAIYPIEPKIINQRHQLRDGSLCILPFAPDYWRVGLTCEDVLKRVVKWYQGYESNTLGDEFAPPEIEVYFPNSYHNKDLEVLAIDTLLLPGEKIYGSCLLYPTKPNNFAFLTTLDDLQKTEEKSAEVIKMKKLILPDENLKSGETLTGLWFRLKGEPNLPVPLNSTALAKILFENEFEQHLIFRLCERKPEIVALLYPTNVPNEFHWLLFKTTFSYPLGRGLNLKRYQFKFEQLNEKHPISLYPVNHINKETIFRRVSGYEVENLLTKKCLLLGCGSIGSTVGKELIKSGLGSITLIDKEVLKTGNLCRHELGINYLGQPKSESLKLELLRKNPFAEIEALTYDPLTKLNDFSQQVEKADIVVSCFANDSTEAFVNTICRRLRKPVIYCRSYMEGRLGEILLAKGEATSTCFQCAADFLGDSSNKIPRPPLLTYEEEVGFDGDCGTAFLPASSVDLGIISFHCVRLTLNFLQNKLEDNNYWLIRGRELDETEYKAFVGEIREPFKVHSYVIPPKEKCNL